MALQLTFGKDKEAVTFGVGDVIRVTQRIKEGSKEREQTFEGTVLKIRGHAGNKTFTVRKIGVQQIGIERIFNILSPALEKITVIRSGLKGVRHAKIYFIRHKPRREIEKIYSRASLRK